MKINTNMSAIRTLTSLTKANGSASKAMERLSSGLRINSAADDAAGMAISRKMNTQVKGLDQANRNAMDGISMIQTAEGALDEVHSMLQRMRELSVQASNGTYENADRETIEQEINQLMQEMEAMKERTQFNKMNLLDGSYENFTLHIGANKDQCMNIDGEEISIENILTPLQGIDIVTKADEAIQKVDAAIEKTSAIRGRLGAYQNRLEHTVSNIQVSEENMTASMSRIQDADMAEEMTDYTQYNVISQAATAMLAQANQRPQQVLQLLNS
ncbi:flagellin N-terminal helical domain-containing protein [Cellulosilyticum lentocellum]|uniref:Flagellin n=1 Tax=Cellulosilyticum lentocellum (strain ATCC 49066 / DSM 5427 / NCIMB 11756 / RHM5) TaxID=642492 RepID=F2JRG4_CELLD|nr:flagellin [Cellulosilyticum lentocellum]ADZ82773.1 flagellin domain protein [Cellulosilyticum lentocellum DSM 5427]